MWLDVVREISRWKFIVSKAVLYGHLQSTQPDIHPVELEGILKIHKMGYIVIECIQVRAQVFFY